MRAMRMPDPGHRPVVGIRGARVWILIRRVWIRIPGMRPVYVRRGLFTRLSVVRWESHTVDRTRV
jgi:hypothetical protein